MEKSSAGVYQAGNLSSLEWLHHGFGSRASEGWIREYTGAKQTHSDTVVVSNGITGSAGEADALISSELGQMIGIRTADCVPLLLADPVNRVVAAIHAGWRGTVADIAAKTVRQMASRFSTDPAQLLAAIGPCIGLCCFEVGPEVAQQLQPLFPEKVDDTHFDLAEANRRQLAAVGVASGHIETSGLCTFCLAEELHSYRREGNLSGRMVAAIGITR
ncbi:MAG TPA: peptidoglycan editing factor PgeF [Bryobacteraceae bacterium]|nr:peptidoglycan editing factor PgeF [Bryobacteraceae bacterium]